jgi:hypothetical protein
MRLEVDKDNSRIYIRSSVQWLGPSADLWIPEGDRSHLMVLSPEERSKLMRENGTFERYQSACIGMLLEKAGYFDGIMARRNKDAGTGT